MMTPTSSANHIQECRLFSSHPHIYIWIADVSSSTQNSVNYVFKKSYIVKVNMVLVTQQAIPPEMYIPQDRLTPSNRKQGISVRYFEDPISSDNILVLMQE